MGQAAKLSFNIVVSLPSTAKPVSSVKKTFE